LQRHNNAVLQQLTKLILDKASEWHLLAKYQEIFLIKKKKYEADLGIVFNSFAKELLRQEQVYFDSNPLAEVVAMAREGMKPFEVRRVLFETDRSSQVKVTDQDRDIANKVRRHFQHKFLLMQLKQKRLTEFQLAVQEVLLRNQYYLFEEEMSLFVKLYPFYLEDKQVESILDESKRIPIAGGFLLLNNVRLKYVGNVERKTKSKNELRYFWRTPEDHLVSVAVSSKCCNNQAWKMVSMLPEITITGSVSTFCLPGTDFEIAGLERGEFEIFN